MSELLDLHVALARMLQPITRLSTERVPLDEAMGRILANDLRAPAALPAFDHSAMDGYAIELETRGESRTVRGESAAGGGLPPALERGSAMRIFTGAPLPSGANAVVMQEDVERNGDAMTMRRVPRAWENVRRVGDDIARGALAIASGTRLRPTHVGALATFGALRPEVVRMPIVAILSTGDELRDASSEDRPGSVVDSNGPSIAACVRACGGVPRLLPVARDTDASLRSALEAALDGTDVAITIGGVSVGDHDRVRPVLASLGVSLDFWRVAIKPGKPIAFGRRGRTSILALPGNPASALLTFLLFGVPLLRTLSGERDRGASTGRALLSARVQHKPGRMEFVRGTLRLENGTAIATPVSSQASGSVVSFAAADTLIIVPKDAGDLEAGASVEVIELDRVLRA